MPGDLERVVEGWFARHGGGGLVLPDGWFGRPHDNVHQLTFVASRPAWLIIELDERLLLTIHDPGPVLDSDDLVIAGFSTCSFDWIEYGSERRHSSRYQAGEVRVVAPAGG